MRKGLEFNVSSSSLYSPVSNAQDFNDKTLSRAYDLNLNGNEIGGGSVRIHKKSEQLKVFQALKLTDSEIDNKFGFFLKSLNILMPTSCRYRQMV